MSWLPAAERPCCHLGAGPEAAKPADNCGSYWAPQEHVADGLGLGGGAAAGKRATCLL